MNHERLKGHNHQGPPPNGEDRPLRRLVRTFVSARSELLRSYVIRKMLNC